MHVKQVASLFIILLLLTACGGGPAASPTEPPPEPTAAPVVEEAATAETTEEATTDEEAEEMTEEETAEEASASASRPGFGDAWTSVDCDTLGVAAEIAPMADCGYVTVPESRTGDSDATIQLAVVRVHSEAESPATPVFLAVGGPGGNGLIRASDISFLIPYGPVIADHDFIFFSQRGTEHAQPHLTCPDYINVPVEAARDGWSVEERQAQLVATMQACIDEATAQGIDLSAYNTDENAADIDSIRQALGYDQIILYGQSYGTQVAEFVMRNHPDILESVILDGILAVTATAEAQYSSHRDAFQRFFTACAADPACSEAYPDPEGALSQAYETLEANPQQIEAIVAGQPMTMTVDGTLALTVMYSYSFAHGRYAPIPAAAYQMSEGDWSLLSTMLSDVYDPIDYLMHLPIICTDDPNTALSDVDTTDTAEMYIDVEYEDANRYVALCPLFNATQLSDSSDELIVSDIPTLLLQGGLDPATAVANGNIVETGLSNSYNIVFPDGTHIQGGSPCGVAIMAAFMADPSTAPDTSCIAQEYSFAVPLPVTVHSEDGSASMSLTLPPGWAPYNDGFLSSSSTIQFYPSVLPPQPLEDVLASMTETLPEAAIVDGEPIAGYTTKRYQMDGIASGQAVLAVDFIVFGDENASYFINAQNQEPASLEQWRTIDLPAILATIVVGEE